MPINTSEMKPHECMSSRLCLNTLYTDFFDNIVCLFVFCTCDRFMKSEIVQSVLPRRCRTTACLFFFRFVFSSGTNPPAYWAARHLAHLCEEAVVPGPHMPAGEYRACDKMHKLIRREL